MKTSCKNEDEIKTILDLKKKKQTKKHKTLEKQRPVLLEMQKGDLQTEGKCLLSYMRTRIIRKWYSCG